jgi:MerR family mercuric resistance operon transcriptional regulator
MDRAEFRIGEVAARAGVTVDALRYYERRKLLPRANRSSGGFRLFGPESIERVQFIKHAQQLGLTLDEIKGLLATGGAEECGRVRDLLSKKIEEIDARMDSMRKFRRVLARHLNECERELCQYGQNACCPVLAIGKQKGSSKRGDKKNAHGRRNS